MSAEAAPAPSREFSPVVILALVLVGVVAFAGMTVLAAYAPDLRSGDDGRAHSLSKSAVGFAGAVILTEKLGTPVVVSRTRPNDLERATVVLTPDGGVAAQELRRFAGAWRTVIVLPKWGVTADPLRTGRVRKAGLNNAEAGVGEMLSEYSKTTLVDNRKGVTRPVLRGVGRPFMDGTVLPLDAVDRLQTIRGAGWTPVLTDETGGVVLASSKKDPDVWVLADPDLLNNQGLAKLANARAGMAVLDAARAGEGPILFDVTLNGHERGRGLLRTMLAPPWLAATLCGVAAAMLMGLHALARFGQPRRAGRAFALGARALVDNSAGLVRMARREHELAPAYAALVKADIGTSSGGHDEAWLEELARRRGAASPAELTAEAEAAKTRDDLLAVARRLWTWKAEMTRGRG